MIKMLILWMLFVMPVAAFADSDVTMAPDGSYVGGSRATMAPDGTYVGGTHAVMAPDGKYVGDYGD